MVLVVARTNNRANNSLLILSYFMVVLSIIVAGSNPECPCINATSILAAQSNCFFEDADGNGNGGRGILIDGKCNAFDYGSNVCGAHDLIARPSCSNGATGGFPSYTAPAYCSQPFCYVDPNQCRNSTEHYYSSSFEGLFYSYSTCGSTAQEWLLSDTINALANKTLTVALPTIQWPFHYKEDKFGNLYEQDSPEANNETIPWKGIFIDYFNAVINIGKNIGPVKFVHRSKGSETKGSPSSWTQAVSDVQAGVVDLAVSDFWVTTERLSMSSFTVPIALDSFVLWIPQPDNENDSFWENVQKILMPFSTGLWFAIFGSILTFALLSVLVSPEDRRVFSNKDPETTWEKFEQWWIILTDSLSTSTSEFLGGAVDPTREINLSQKCLNAGFAFIIFITVTAYTANLAAFLTLSGNTKYFNNIDEAISANTLICAHYNVKEELQLVYPNARWRFQSATSKVKQAYADGECGAIVLGWTSVRSNPVHQEFFCKHKLVKVGHSIIDKQMAFPIKADLAAGMSHWIAQAQTVGISYESYIMRTDAQCKLDIILTMDNGNTNSKLKQLTTNNMTLPLVGFLVACIMAVVIHFTKGLRKEEVRQSMAITLQSNLNLLGVETESFLTSNRTRATTDNKTDGGTATEGGTAQSDDSINNNSQMNVVKMPSTNAFVGNDSSLEKMQEAMARLCAQQDLILQTLANKAETKDENTSFESPVPDKNHSPPDRPKQEVPSNSDVSISVSTNNTPNEMNNADVPYDEALHEAGWAKEWDPTCNLYYYYSLDGSEESVWENPLLHQTKKAKTAPTEPLEP